MNRTETIQRQVRPIHPGEMIREDFAVDFGLSPDTLAAALFIPIETATQLMEERTAVSPELALRLSRLFGTGPEFWLNAQRSVDLWDAAHDFAAELDRIQPITGNAAP